MQARGARFRRAAAGELISASRRRIGRLRSALATIVDRGREADADRAADARRTSRQRSRRLVPSRTSARLTEFEGVQERLLRQRQRGGAHRPRRHVVASSEDQRAILTPLMLMRRFEVEYRLTRATDPGAFKRRARQFQQGVRRRDRRRHHEGAAHRPGEALYRRLPQWIESNGKIARSRRSSRSRYPDAARRRRDHRRPPSARHRGGGSRPRRARPKMLIIGVGIAVVPSACCSTELIGRSITGRSTAWPAP